MKRLRLVSNTTPSSLQKWLGKKLEDRGIDSFYARSILSLLQQECVDLEPHECQHTRNSQLKVLHKYGGPDNLYSAAKSRHQKGKKWGKQIFLTSAPCCKAAYSDFERSKKKAALDCLRSAADYIDDEDIEDLIDATCVELKNVKKLNGEKEDCRSGNTMQRVDSFFIPPSSPTNEVEKYFAAFPPLSGNVEGIIIGGPPKAKENVWWDRCFLEEREKTQNENACNLDNHHARNPSKSMQPIIPYSSLKSIKNIYKMQHGYVSETNDCGQATISLAYKIMQPIINQNVILSFRNLRCIEISNISVKKYQLLHYLKSANIPDFLIILRNGTCSSVKNVVEISSLSKKSQTPAVKGFIKKMSIALKMTHKVIFPQDKHFENGIRCNNMILKTSVTNNKSINQSGLINVNHGINPYVLETFDYAETVDKEISKPDVSLKLNCLGSVDDPQVKAEVNSTLKNIIQLFRGTDDTAASFEEINTLSSDKKNYGIDEACKQESSYFTLSKIHNTYEIYGDISMPTSLSVTMEGSPMESEPKPTFLEVGNKFSISRAPNICENSDDEIFCSDDDSNEIFHSDDEENMHMSVKTHFHPLFFSSSSDSYSELGLPIKKLENISLSRKIESKYNSETSFLEDAKPLYSLKSCCASLPNTNFRSFLSPHEELTFIPTNQDEKHSDVCIISEQNNEFEQLDDLLNKGINCENFVEPPICSAENCTLKTHFYDGTLFSEKSKLTSIKKFNEMWFLNWGDDHALISNIWQKESEYTAEILNNKNRSLDPDMISALHQELKEEGDELLKGLCPLPYINDSVSEFNSERHKCHQNNVLSDRAILHTAEFPNSQEGQILELHEISRSENFLNKHSEVSLSNFDTSFTLHNIKAIKSEMPNTNKFEDYNVPFEKEFFKTAVHPELSAFSHDSENTDAFKRGDYLEGGGWSLASENFIDYTCDNSYERSYSLGDLDLEKSEPGYFEYCERIHCNSVSIEDGIEPIYTPPPSYIDKKIKHKFLSKRRPCCFFLQGSCTRSDCKFSHDFSTTTCRFWKEGSCFKGETCPFLHGYLKECNKDFFVEDPTLKNDIQDNCYSLESEADFPSLLSTTSEGQRKKSEAINIVQVKGLKKVEKIKSNSTLQL